MRDSTIFVLDRHVVLKYPGVNLNFSRNRNICINITVENVYSMLETRKELNLLFYHKPLPGHPLSHPPSSFHLSHPLIALTCTSNILIFLLKQKTI